MKISFKNLILNRLILGILCLCTMFSLQGFDLPVFYRAPFFQPEATDKVDDWTTVISARVGFGDTSDSFDNDEERTALFNAHGPFDLTRLGLNVEGVTLEAKPITFKYWGPDGLFANPNPTPTDPNTFAYPNGRVEFSGDFNTTEYALTLKQNLMWGFYAHIYVPYKEVKIKNITPKNLGAKVIGEGDKAVDMDDFIKIDLPKILAENGLKTATDDQGEKILPTTFKDSGFGDCSFSLGWQGYRRKLCGLLTSYGGLLQMGIVAPVAKEQDSSNVFSVPLGYNGHVGVVSRLAIEVGVWNIFNLGVQAGSLIFFKNSRDLFLKTDKQQTGWIFLQKAHVKEDLGSIWDIGAYAKMNLFVKGLDALIGYSFVRKDQTTLQVEDANYLKTAQAKVQAQLDDGDNPVHIGTDAPNIIFISQNDFANSDARLVAWETQTIHFLLRYDMSAAIKGGWGPLFQFEYNYPIWGKHSFATDVFAGTLGFTVTLCF